MTFYIPEFWCGVIATVVFKVCMVIGADVISTHRKDKKKGEKDIKEEADGLVGTYDDRGEWQEMSIEDKKKLEDDLFDPVKESVRKAEHYALEQMERRMK